MLQRDFFFSAEVHVIMVCALKASFAGYKVLGSHFAEYFQYYFLFIAVQWFHQTVCGVYSESVFSCANVVSTQSFFRNIMLPSVTCSDVPSLSLLLRIDHLLNHFYLFTCLGFCHYLFPLNVSSRLVFTYK